MAKCKYCNRDVQSPTKTDKEICVYCKSALDYIGQNPLAFEKMFPEITPQRIPK